MSCDIGDINISGGDIKFENGQFNATGSFSIIFHGKDSLSYGYFSDSSSSSGSPYLAWTWDGTHKNILKTDFGDIVLTPAAGAPRMDIEFPEPDYYENGKKVINHNERMKEQGCIQQ